MECKCHARDSAKGLNGVVISVAKYGRSFSARLLVKVDNKKVEDFKLYVASISIHHGFISNGSRKKQNKQTYSHPRFI